MFSEEVASKLMENRKTSTNVNEQLLTLRKELVNGSMNSFNHNVPCEDVISDMFVSMDGTPKFFKAKTKY